MTRAPGAKIVIGDNVGISGATIYARKGIYIGENTCIGGNCKILDNDFHPIDAVDRLKLLQDIHGGDSDLVPSREIHIGKNCFIGCNTIILKGTVLGDGCVVGAGAVVSGKFEDNCVIAGNLSLIHILFSLASHISVRIVIRKAAARFRVPVKPVDLNQAH